MTVSELFLAMSGTGLGAARRLALARWIRRRMGPTAEVWVTDYRPSDADWIAYGLWQGRGHYVSTPR